MFKYTKRLSGLNIFNKRVKQSISQEYLMVLRQLGNPQHKLPTFHVAGTNGKGSVVQHIAQTLAKQAKKIGIYTSPHLFTIRQRIRVNSQLISSEDFEQCLKEVFQRADLRLANLSFFDTITAASFHYFNRKKCDGVVLEVGMGGRLDSTNVLHNNSLPIITSIGLDHCEILGETQELIAQEKAAIIKPYCAAVLGPSCTQSAFLQQSERKHAKLVMVKKVQQQPFWLQNKRIAEQALKQAKKIQQFYRLGNYRPDYTEQSVDCFKPSCRMQLVPSSQTKFPWFKGKIYLDVGHNPPAISRAIRSLGVKPTVIFNTSSKKDLPSMMKLLGQLCNQVYLLKVNHPRCYQIQRLQEQAERLQLKYRVVAGGEAKPTVESCLRGSEVVVGMGSFFIMQQLSRALGLERDCDILDFNEIYQLQR